MLVAGRLEGSSRGLMGASPSAPYTGYSLFAHYAVSVTLSVNGTALPLRGYVSFDRAGTYVFTVSASNGVVTVTRTYKIEVKPRPLVVGLDVPPARAYDTVNVRVKAFDGLSGSAVTDVYCVLEVGGASLTVRAWDEVPVYLAPTPDAEPVADVSVSCADGSYYALVSRRFNVRLEPVTASISIDYLGAGVVVISFTGPRGEPVNGSVKVYVDGKFHSEGRVPHRVEGLKPGATTLRVEFTPASPVYRSSVYEVRLAYYGDLREVPGELVTSAVVADRVVTLNTTVTETVTEHRPVYIPTPVPPTLEERLAPVLLALAAGAVAGLVLSWLLLVRSRTPGQAGGRSLEVDLESS